MLKADPDPRLALDLVRLRVAAGADVGDLAVLPERGRRAVAVALAVGAPLVDAIDGAQGAEDDAARARRAVTVASAQARAVAGGLIVAPVVLVPGLGRLVGADLAGFYTSPLGVGVLAVASLLLAIGAGAIVLLVRRVGHGRGAPSRPGSVPGIGSLASGIVAWQLVGPPAAIVVALLAHRVLRRRATTPHLLGVDEVTDLIATALAGGVATPEALRLTAEYLPDHAARLGRLALRLELGMGPDRSDAPALVRGPGRANPDPFARLALVLSTAEELGAGIGPTLRRLATDLRADELARVLAAAERLPAQLTFPTALCLLPATFLLVGAPIVHAGLVAAGT